MSRENMYKLKKTSHTGASGSKKMILPMIILMFFMCISSVSATATNSTYVAGTGEAIVYFGLNGVLLLFLAGCFLIFLNYDNLLARVGSLGMGYLLLIAVSFVSWQMASDFITSAFLIEMFRIIFLVLMIGAFPLLIGAFAWYLIMLFKIKEIERLMSKGMDQDEAERRTGRKFKR
jgi:hypothetical protein